MWLGIDSSFILIQIGRIHIKYLSITNKMGKFNKMMYNELVYLSKLNKFWAC